MTRATFSAAVLLALGAGLASAAISDPVHVDTGLVSGTNGATPEMRIYKGIPYAAAPVGNLRWRGPQPVAHWDGVRKAEEYSAPCLPNMRGSEDCLYLNVWTAAKSAGDRRPVMVWIYGGGFTGGAGSLPDYNGEMLAKKGAVVVTFNYRLGAFGFFSHPELTQESDRGASGNQGFLDMLAALEWVQKNIAAFGGDPKRVTIFGESAGSMAVADLMASPLAKGLFIRAMGESGGMLNGLSIGRFPKLADAEQAGVKMAEALNAKSLADLRALPAEAIQKGGRGSGAIVDGWFLPQDPDTVFTHGKQNAVPVLVGSNKDEGTFFVRPTTADAFLQQAKRRFGDLADGFLKIYPAGSDEEANNSALRAFADEAAWVMREWARAEEKSGKTKAYVYYFTHEPPAVPGRGGKGGGRARGATHVAEVPYVFQTQGNRPWTDVDHQLSDTMSSYWVNFATNGDPNGKGLAKWPVFDEKKSASPMVLGDKVEVGPGALDAAKLSFFEAVYEKQKEK
jgi:para-nitrobenzyl esterase